MGVGLRVLFPRNWAVGNLHLGLGRKEIRRKPFVSSYPEVSRPPETQLGRKSSQVLLSEEVPQL